MSNARAQWIDFLNRSLAARLDFDDFKAFVELLSSKHQLPPTQIADIFLAPTEHNGFCLDMRIPRYILILLDLNLVDVPTILSALRRYSTFKAQAEVQPESHNGAPTEATGKRWIMSYSTDEILFYRLTKHIVSTGASETPTEPAHLLHESIQWMRLATTASHSAHDVLNLPKHVQEMNMATTALGTLLVAVVDDAHVQRVLGKSKDVGRRLSDALAAFVPLLMQSSPQSAARLELFRSQTLVAILPVEKKEDKESTASKEIDQMLDDAGGSLELELGSMGVVDLPIMNGRAGLYIYLNSLVSYLRSVEKLY